MTITRISVLFLIWLCSGVLGFGQAQTYFHNTSSSWWWLYVENDQTDIVTDYGKTKEDMRHEKHQTLSKRQAIAIPPGVILKIELFQQSLIYRSLVLHFADSNNSNPAGLKAHLRCQIDDHFPDSAPLQDRSLIAKPDVLAEYDNNARKVITVSGDTFTIHKDGFASFPTPPGAGQSPASASTSASTSAPGSGLPPRNPATAAAAESSGLRKTSTPDPLPAKRHRIDESAPSSALAAPATLRIRNASGLSRTLVFKGLEQPLEVLALGQNLGHLFVPGQAATGYVLLPQASVTLAYAGPSAPRTLRFSVATHQASGSTPEAEFSWVLQESAWMGGPLHATLTALAHALEDFRLGSPPPQAHVDSSECLTLLPEPWER